jgi:hypothetical protein
MLWHEGSVQSAYSVPVITIDDQLDRPTGQSFYGREYMMVEGDGIQPQYVTLGAAIMKVKY